MELTVFDAAVSKKQKPGRPTVRINFKIGTFTIGLAAMELMGIRAGDQVKIGCNEKTQDWFIWKVNKEGFLLRLTRTKGVRAVIFNSAFTTEAIAKSTGYIGDSAALKVGSESVNSGDDRYIDYWPLITAAIQT